MPTSSERKPVTFVVDDLPPGELPSDPPRLEVEPLYIDWESFSTFFEMDEESQRRAHEVICQRWENILAYLAKRAQDPWR